MNEEEKALHFLMSRRGNLIMGQALVIAIEKLRFIEEPYREVSNINDMEYLLDNLFPIGKVIAEAQTLIREQQQ